MSKNSSEAELWHAQFDRSLDFSPTNVATKYVICTSPRSGSHFFGHRLYRASGFGYPLEYLQAANFERWRQRAAEAGESDPLAYIKSVRTDANGVFGIKAHYRHLRTFLAHEPNVLEYRFITLERRDLLRQAVSYSWAAQTRSWISGMPARGTATYDWNDIARRLEEITESNAGWKRFLAGLGVMPCALVFEDVRADPEGAIRKVAAFLNVTPGAGAGSSTFSPEEQSSEGKNEWLERFATEARKRLGHGQWPYQIRSTGWSLRRFIESLSGTRVRG
jgi:trehalose 2-sulfotransferase